MCWNDIELEAFKTRCFTIKFKTAIVDGKHEQKNPRRCRRCACDWFCDFTGVAPPSISAPTPVANLKYTPVDGLAEPDDLNPRMTWDDQVPI